jgi:hypothetical protein
MATSGETAGMIGTRRRLMQLAGAALAASASGPPVTGVADQQDMVHLFAEPEAATAIGRAYLATQPAQTLEALRIALMAALQRNASTPPSQARLAARFRAHVRRDFGAARVVLVDGWMLSQIEAQACATVYLNVAREV